MQKDDSLTGISSVPAGASQPAAIASTTTDSATRSSPDIGVIWDLCLTVEYDRDQLIRGLTAWLGDANSLEILDCACGNGFPALDLHRLGYQVTCTDASAMMLQRFRRNAVAAGFDLAPLQASWEELQSLYPNRFDVVLCRGSSLIYAGTWDSESDPDPSALENSIRSMVGCLRPSGRLYVDSTHEDDLLVIDSGWLEHTPRSVHGHDIEMREKVLAEPDIGVRRWLIHGRLDGAPFEIERKSHFLTHSKLTGLLEAAGLEDVGRIDVTGENYAVFSGNTPP